MRIILALMLVFSAVASAEIYKWTDENGQVHFGDRPTESVKAETVEIREQKTGRMVSGSTQQAYSTKVSEPKKKGTESIDCTQAKETLALLRAELRRLKLLGIEPLKEIQTASQIDLWEAQAKVMCSR